MHTKALRNSPNKSKLPSLKWLHQDPKEKALIEDIVKLDISLSSLLASHKSNEMEVNSRRDDNYQQGHIFTHCIDYRGAIQIKQLINAKSIGHGFSFLGLMGKKPSVLAVERRQRGNSRLESPAQREQSLTVSQNSKSLQSSSIMKSQLVYPDLDHFSNISIPEPQKNSYSPTRPKGSLKLQFLNPKALFIKIDQRRPKSRILTEGSSLGKAPSSLGKAPSSLGKELPSIHRERYTRSNLEKSSSNPQYNSTPKSPHRLQNLLLAYIGPDVKERVVATWAPPVSRPNMTGFFTYSFKHNTCQIKEYLWCTSVLSSRYFEATIKNLSRREHSPVYSLFTVAKLPVFLKYLRACGWMEVQREAGNHVRIQFRPSKMTI